MSGTINLALSQQFDMDGDPLSGGRLYFFAAGTSTPQNSFQDTGLTILHPNPLILDASGRVPMFYLADGQIKIRLEDEGGLIIISADNLLVIGPSTGGGGGGSVDATTVMQTGDVKARYGTGSHTGFVRCNGNTIGNAASSSSERANADAENLFKYLWTTALPMLTSAGGAAVKTTANADWTGNNRMTLPDLRGRTIAGMDDMGAAAAGRLTATYFGAAGTTLGNAGGSESKALTIANLASHTHPATSNSTGSHTHGFGGTTDPAGSHTHAAFNSSGGGPSGGGNLKEPGTTFGTTSADGSHQHNYGGTTDPDGNHSHTITVSTNASMLSTPVAVASPSLVMTFYMKL